MCASLEMIPHREPFLFIDDVIELQDERILTTKRADPHAEFFKGHYPGNPVMPGVLLCECCFQAGALLIAHKIGQYDQAGTPVITRIKDAKFKRVVRPGDELAVEVVVDETLNDVYFMTGRARVGGALAVRVEFAATLIEENSP